MSGSRTMKLLAGVAVPVAFLGLLIGCSTDSPTAPQQQPAPPPGPPSAVWVLNVTVSPGEAEVGSSNPLTVTVDVRRADTGVAPASGTTIVVSTSLGEFGTLGSGLSSVALSTINGLAQVFLFPGTIKGTGLITAQLEASAGQTTFVIGDVLIPVVAAFETQNSESNLSIRFRDASTGDPTSWDWDFGDGGSSSEQNPAHLYALPGDYVVTLTASKPDSSSTISQLVNVTRDPDNEIEAAFSFTQDGLTVVFQDQSEGNPTRWRWDFGDGTSSALQNPTKRYTLEGTFVVTLTASNKDFSGSTSELITVTRNLFVSDITPNAGPAAGGQVVTITGTGFTTPLRVFFGGVLATTVSSTPTVITVITPPGVLGTAPCNDNMDMTVGEKAADTLATVVVELGSGTSHSVQGGYTYLAPAGAPCNGD
ncbi:MAG: PKD domain-containing protein [Thermoanaerobaculia bacterium]